MADVDVVKDEVDKQQFDASRILGKKPGRWYRWGRDDPRNLVVRRMEGYEVCHDPDIRSALGPNTRVKKGEDVDDTIKWGDMVLLETSLENHEKLVSQDHEKIVRRTKGVMANFNQKIREAGGEPFEEHGRDAKSEGKGYGKGFTEEDVKRELEAMPEQEGTPAWRNRRE